MIVKISSTFFQAIDSRRLNLKSNFWNSILKTYFLKTQFLPMENHNICSRKNKFAYHRVPLYQQNQFLRKNNLSKKSSAQWLKKILKNPLNCFFLIQKRLIFQKTTADFRYFYSGVPILRCLKHNSFREIVFFRVRLVILKLASATNSTKKVGSLKLRVGNCISAWVYTNKTIHTSLSIHLNWLVFHHFAATNSLQSCKERLRLFIARSSWCIMNIRFIKNTVFLCWRKKKHYYS